MAGRSRPRRIHTSGTSAPTIYALGLSCWATSSSLAGTVHREEPGRDSAAQVTQEPVALGDAAPRRARRASQVIMRCLKKLPARTAGRAPTSFWSSCEPLATPSGARHRRRHGRSPGAPAGRRFARWLAPAAAGLFLVAGVAFLRAPRGAASRAAGGASHAGDARPRNRDRLRRSAPDASSSPMWPDRSGHATLCPPARGGHADRRRARRSWAGSAGPPGSPDGRRLLFYSQRGIEASPRWRITAPASCPPPA